ncbi:hypothetical protein GH733_002433 [Mirounga leonina]|nr:hypothetical protein GH733_002433 [Mirounga leonina]
MLDSPGALKAAVQRPAAAQAEPRFVEEATLTAGAPPEGQEGSSPNGIAQGGSLVGVYKGKTFNQMEIKPEMIGHTWASSSPPTGL